MLLTSSKCKMLAGNFLWLVETTLSKNITNESCFNQKAVFLSVFEHFVGLTLKGLRRY